VISCALRGWGCACSFALKVKPNARKSVCTGAFAYSHTPALFGQWFNSLIPCTYRALSCDSFSGAGTAGGLTTMRETAQRSAICAALPACPSAPSAALGPPGPCARLLHLLAPLSPTLLPPPPLFSHPPVSFPSSLPSAFALRLTFPPPPPLLLPYCLPACALSPATSAPSRQRVPSSSSAPSRRHSRTRSALRCLPTSGPRGREGNSGGVSRRCTLLCKGERRHGRALVEERKRR